MSHVLDAPALPMAKAKARVAASPDLEPMFTYTERGKRNFFRVLSDFLLVELTVLPSVDTTNDRDNLGRRNLKLEKLHSFISSKQIVGKE